MTHRNAILVYVFWLVIKASINMCCIAAELAASSDSPSSGKQDTLEEAEQSLHQQQQQFVANLLSDPARRQVHTFPS